MTMRTVLFVLSPVLALAPAADAGRTATFQWLDQSLSADDMTPDGSIVVGTAIGGGAYSWSEAGGYTFIGGGSAIAVSDDGSVILGTMDNPANPGEHVAAIWSETDGWQTIGGLPDGPCGFSLSSAYELNAAGDVAVGLGWINGCNGNAFRWTATGGMTALENLANGTNRASVVSADGSLIGGFAQGSFSRTPAIWHADGSGELLDPPNGDVLGEVHGISDDGSILLGEWDGSAFYRTEADGVVTFSTVISSWVGIATDIADEGTIVGFDVMSTARLAWARFPGGPTRHLRNFLVFELAVPGVPSSLEVCQAVSTDGRTIIGHNGFANGWIVRLSPNPDIDGDGVVAFGDLLRVLAAWGPCGAPCWEDLDDDGEVAFGDVLVVLSCWSE